MSGVDDPAGPACPFLVLIGLRGSGKTSIGAATAARLGMRFVDLDERVLADFAEPSVEAIFHRHGEAAFRLAEVVALREALSGVPAVVSLGGGTASAAGGSQMLKEAAKIGLCGIVLLDARNDTLLARILADRDRRPGGRPPLTDRSDAEELRLLRLARDPLHAGLADWRIETDDLSIEEAARQVAEWHRRFRRTRK